MPIKDGVRLKPLQPAEDEGAEDFVGHNTPVE